mgnify:CR=1 FL=1
MIGIGDAIYWGHDLLGSHLRISVHLVILARMSQGRFDLSVRNRQGMAAAGHPPFQPVPHAGEPAQGHPFPAVAPVDHVIQGACRRGKQKALSFAKFQCSMPIGGIVMGHG